MKTDLQDNFAFQPEECQVMVALRVVVVRVQYRLCHWDVLVVSPVSVVVIIVFAKAYHIGLTEHTTKAMCSVLGVSYIHSFIHTIS